MTVREYLRFVGKIKGVRANLKDRVDAVMKKTWIADMADRHCAKLSKGYKQRVGLAQGVDSRAGSARSSTSPPPVSIPSRSSRRGS
jgi:ABC-type Na+ transport system ATPase subunit NatA